MGTYYSVREKEMGKIPDENLATYVDNNAWVGSSSQMDLIKKLFRLPLLF